MKKSTTIGGLGLGALLISGCALPVPLQVASWAIDGVSYVITEKSITDHGLSALARKDCAVWRGVVEGELCRNWASDRDTLLAYKFGLTETTMSSKETKAEPKSTFGSFRLPPLGLNLIKIEPYIKNQAKFDIAAYPKDAPLKGEIKNRFHVVTKSEMFIKASQFVSIPSNELNDINSVFDRSGVSPFNHFASMPPISSYSNRTKDPIEGVYFVIGSFRDYGNARRHMASHGQLLPTVLMAKLKSASIYRVVVGPIARGGERSLHRKIARSGLQDTWAIRVKPGDWSLANDSIKQVQRTEEHPELAKLP